MAMFTLFPVLARVTLALSLTNYKRELYFRRMYEFLPWEWLSVYNKHECKRIFPGWLQGWEDWIQAPLNPLVVEGAWASQHPLF